MDRPRRAVRSNPSRAAKVKRPVRATRSTATYFASPSSSSSSPLSPSSSDTDVDIDVNDDDYQDHKDDSTSTRSLTRKRKNSFNEDPSPRKHPRRSSEAVYRASNKTRAPQTPKSTTPTPAPAVETSDTPAVYPPWTTAPYLVFVSVFDYIAAPIRDPSSRREDVFEAVATLTSAARACKTFTEPALKNLYKCPPFLHQWRYTKAPNLSFSQFINTLNLPSDTTVINYHPKVEILRLAVRAVIGQKNSTNYTSLPEVARNLPRLSHLELYHEFDEPPYRRLDEHIRFKCSSDELMEILAPQTGDERNNAIALTELQSWRWNSRLTDESLSLDKLEKFHKNPNFVTLRKVAFLNYQLPSWGLIPRLRDTKEMQEQDALKITQLAACISALPHLEHLTLESCTLANGSLLQQLPKTLKRLELINCWEVTATDLYEFLLTHGGHLQSLTLNHCQSLSLGFLPVLRSACPNLEHLYMDLSYFRHHEHYADNKPEYETLLTEDEVPAWPSSIQSIEILHMRKWGRRAAETFFGSLLQSAQDLPYLRRLAFRVALDIGWRQRRELRELWVDKMTKVFKRKSKPPRNLTTISDVPTEVQQKTREESRSKDKRPLAAPMRRSTRLADISPAQTSSESDKASVSKRGTTRASVISKRGMARASAISKELKRLRGSGMLLKEQDADDEESEDELAADHSEHSYQGRKVRRISKHSPANDEYIHGLCDIVDIQVDNHRPTERQFDMDDFLDSVEESDPDWDGGDVDVFD
ncbi:hypothetical protein GGR53DRAFT_473672 [Hypoxylon sp. FL1150]|nr:hypothetical protein GGR53DRAFT_473672 [Hypoxylon sp. FL1150]